VIFHFGRLFVIKLLRFIILLGFRSISLFRFDSMLSLKLILIKYLDIV